MKTVISILLSMLIFIIVSVGIIGVSEIKNEQAEVRSVWGKMLREMAADGYLADSVVSHYSDYLKAQGYEQDFPYFQASHTNSNNRAIRPQHGKVATSDNIVRLSIEVEPKPFIKAIKFLRDGQPNFIFSDTRISEYLPIEGDQP
ncbi:hypothetical protein ABEX29_01220 [Brevibacillus porteri]|uniref:hypothetical protein n=1 Tax=Brevibacillus porteri TaxID=2126350 RepID=UPI003D1A56BA